MILKVELKIADTDLNTKVSLKTNHTNKNFPKIISLERLKLMPENIMKLKSQFSKLSNLSNLTLTKFKRQEVVITINNNAISPLLTG